MLFSMALWTSFYVLYVIKQNEKILDLLVCYLIYERKSSKIWTTMNSLPTQFVTNFPFWLSFSLQILGEVGMYIISILKGKSLKKKKKAKSSIIIFNGTKSGRPLGSQIYQKHHHLAPHHFLIPSYIPMILFVIIITFRA